MKFRRLLCLLLAVLLLGNLGLPALAVSAGEAVAFTVTADKASYETGDTVKLTIRQSEEVTGLGLWDFTLYFDHEALQLNTDACENKTGRTSVAIAEKISKTGEHQVSMMDTDTSFGSGFSIPGGDIAILTFTALKEGTTEVTCLATMSDSLFVNEYNSNNGNVTVPEKVEISIASSVPTTYTVILPETRTGYTILKADGSAMAEADTTVAENSTFAFRIDVDDDYEGTPVVKAGTETLGADAQGVYSITVNANVTITVEGITEKQPAGSGSVIPEGAPFTALTTADGTEVIAIEEKGTIKYQDYKNIPHYHVTIPEGATGVRVTHPAEEKPFADSNYNSAYGYYADISTWSGAGMSFSFVTAEDGYTVNLPLSTMVDTDSDWMPDTKASFVADEDGVVSYAVAVQRNGNENNGDFSPICFFTFEYGEAAPAPATYTVTLPETQSGYTIVKADGSAFGAADLTVTEGTSFRFKVVVDESNGYEATSAFAVKAGNAELTAAEGVYTVEVNENVVISVAGVARKTYTVTLPTSIAYTVATQQSTTVAHGETFTFTVTVNDDYTGTPVVKAGNDVLTPNADGSYTITVTGNVNIEISGIELDYSGYGVRASQDKTITAGEEAEVAIAVETDDATVYNAYDLTVTYNTDVVNYKSYTAANDSDELTVTADNGTIRIQGYGPDKNVGTAPVTLLFTGKALGDANIKVTQAKVDIGAHAIGNDAPDATVLDDTTVITVTGYTVELGEGLSADSTVAKQGVDYVFYPTDADNYTYVVTYTVDGQTYTATANEDGSYSIPGERITGNIRLSAAMTPRSYQVTISGQDVTGEKTAVYNTAYTFTVNKQSGYTYTVTVLIDNETYFAEENGNTYTIAGTDITGPITITVAKSKTETDDNTVEVSKPGWVTGNSTATKGQNYTFTVPKAEGYTYSDVKVTVGGKDITDKLTVNGSTYTIPAAQVTGKIVISVTRTSTLDVDVMPYITLDDSKVMYLVTASGNFASGYIAKYDGQSMYWSEEYKAYAWLVISSENLQTMSTYAESKVAMAQGTAAGTVVYTGDVNGTRNIDINDAQLTYDMYNAKYGSFTDVSMQKFLNADVNHNKLVDVQDARAIVTAIQ